MTELEARLAELRPYAQQAAQLSGWTFAYTPRPLGAPPPWDYESRARALAAGARSLVDMSTGGGEVLSRVLAGYGGRAAATEAWGPNVPVAARRLGALGVAVVQSRDFEMPFSPMAFDLVLNRHAALLPAEVSRVLEPGGTVLTQQVHPDWHHELGQFFPRMTIFEQHHETYPQGFREAGLKVVDFQQHAQPMAYQHLGEIVYMLVAAPWTVPDFDVEADLDALLRLEHTLRRPEGIVLTDRRYILEAHKPA
jgi:SAM-dependent methyltransferase